MTDGSAGRAAEGRRGVIARLRADPGLALCLLAIALAVALYAATLGYGIVGYDDGWLVRDNWIVHHASGDAIRTILFDLSSPKRFVLTPEYLPVRDLSVMADFAVWGDWFAGHHLTNLVLYVAAIGVWFAALTRFGIGRTIAGVAVLLWAVAPSHAESVAWLAERKGVLGAFWLGVCALGFAIYRSGGRARYLALAMIGAVFAIWSKAPSAFGVAALAALELALPAKRITWRRSIGALAAIAGVAAAAFAPVVYLATRAAVVGTELPSPVGRVATVLGVHGFYLRDVALAMRAAVSYPIASTGPGAGDIALGAFGFVALAALACAPRLGPWKPPAELRAGAAFWLVAYLPFSQVILPLQMVLVADRYLLVPSLGLAVLAACGLVRIPDNRMRAALIAVVVIASGARTLDAQAQWSDAGSLWARAVDSNPADGDAWSNYAETLVEAGEPAAAVAATERELRESTSPRLRHRYALLLAERGETDRALVEMRAAADGGDYRAMSDLALWLSDVGRSTDALAWARRATAAAPEYVNGQRLHGKIALAAHESAEALAAFEVAYALEPDNLANRFNLALALIALGRTADAKPHLDAAAADPALAPRVREIERALP